MSTVTNRNLIIQGGSSSEVREVVGCLSQGFRVVPRANSTTGYGDYLEYHCPRGRKISQTRSHIHRDVTFEQVCIFTKMMMLCNSFYNSRSWFLIQQVDNGTLPCHLCVILLDKEKGER